MKVILSVIANYILLLADILIITFEQWKTNYSLYIS